MKKTLSIIFLFSWLPFLLGIGFDGTDSQVFADTMYMMAGLIWIIVGTWLAIKTLRENK